MYLAYGISLNLILFLKCVQQLRSCTRYGSRLVLRQTALLRNKPAINLQSESTEFYSWCRHHKKQKVNWRCLVDIILM